MTKRAVEMSKLAVDVVFLMPNPYFLLLGLSYFTAHFEHKLLPGLLYVFIHFKILYTINTLYCETSNFNKQIPIKHVSVDLISSRFFGQL